MSAGAVVALLLASAFLILFFPGQARSAPPELWTSCDPSKPADQQCNRPRGLAASPESGRIFVADQFNERTVELDPLGEFVKAWGWDVVAAGPGNQSTEPEPAEFEICVREDGDTCKAGATGPGVGQFQNPLGVALDSAGDVYVVDLSNRRVQKFSRDGEFQLTFGGEVNKTKVEEGTASEAEENLCPFDPGDECQKGVQGTGQGQFGQWQLGSYIAVDPSDNVYVGDAERIQRFGTGGAYQDECSVPGRVRSLAVDSAGDLYAAYSFQLAVRKLSFIAGGDCEETARFELPPPDEFTPSVPTAVTVSADGRVYAFGATSGCGASGAPCDPIVEFDPAGNVTDQFGKGEYNISHGLATNLCEGSEAPGNLYVTNASDSASFVRAYGTEPTGCFKARTLPADPVEETSATLNGTVNPNGELSEECRFEWGTTTEYGSIANCAESEASIGAGTDPVPVHADLTDLLGATTYHFRLRAKINGETETGPDETFKTKGPPVVSDEHVVTATASEAVVRAQVNPEGLPTSCHVEFGAGEALDRVTVPAPVGEDRSEHTVRATLQGLDPGTTYAWRFLCENTAVLDGGVTEGAELTLTTYRPFAAQTDCPNQAQRGGASASLPDCRAYEMVSPVDKNGADITAGQGQETADIAALVHAAPGGEKITYASRFPTFGEDPPHSFPYNQYLASRNGGGWSVRGINQTFTGRVVDGIVAGVPREFMAFTDDLCGGWLVDFQTPALNPDGQEEAANLYRRDNCGAGEGHFETITDREVPLEGEARSHYVDQFSVQGYSVDGRHTIFRAKAKLGEEAAEGTNAQLYDRFCPSAPISGCGEAPLAVVSVLPGGAPDPGEAAMGSGWRGSLKNAVAEDGSVVYWTSEIGTGVRGKIFARTSPEQGIVPGECEGGAACTVAVSKGTTAPFFHNAFFWAARPDGTAAIYSEQGAGQEDLYRFELASGTSELVASDVMGVVGASDDLERIYLVARAALEEGAAAGEPNLYLLDGEDLTFIATLAEGDVGEPEPGTPVANLPYDLVAHSAAKSTTKLRAARVSPDGGSLAFQSRASISVYDNTTGAGEPAVEVYRYEADSEELHCVSCNPAGARPAARQLPLPFRRPGATQPTGVVAAAWIPTWEQPTHATNVLSADGNRLFFNANDALVPHDANGTQDVYEWEAAGTGGCSEADPSFFPQNGGCLYLISSGQSPFESTFWEASADGSNVFFTTAAGLVPPDPGLIDLYDARVGGGFDYPEPSRECEGEACQSPPAPPEFGSPASGSYAGPPDPAPAGNPCRKRAQRAKRLARRAQHARRAARRAARAGKRGRVRKARRTARRSARGARKTSRAAKRCRRARRGGTAR